MTKRKSLYLLIIILLVLVGSNSLHAQLPTAPGPYISPGHTDFSGPSYGKYEYLVTTAFFYWYNIRTGEHIIDSDNTDACTTHYWKWRGTGIFDYDEPPVFSYDSNGWWEEQINDMCDAGIDFMIPVYWGVPGQYNDWNHIGLATLQQVLLSRDSRWLTSPKVGLFYDTTTLNSVDMTTPQGKDQFYGSIRDFYSMIPPNHWARIGGKVVVWLYSSYFPSNASADTFNQAKQRFKNDFGGVDILFVGDNGWKDRFDSSIPIDKSYSWGAALGGPSIHDYSSIGPGYDDSAVHGRLPYYRDRRGGNTYIQDWEQIFNCTSRVIMIETWNEWHEGTDIANSYEYGRQYVNLTAQKLPRFKFRQNYVDTLYRYYLSRDADEEGFKSHTDGLNYFPPSTIREGFLNSPEYKSTVSDAAYVTFLYQNYLNRAPDPGGYSHYLSLLASGYPRSYIRDGILNSVEARSKVSDERFVTNLYYHILFRKPDPAGYQNWMDQLKRGAPRSQVRDGFINSIEFKYLNLTTNSDDRLKKVFDYSGY